MKDSILRDKYLSLQRQVARAVCAAAFDFALAGGTALSWFFLRHRTSYDLDFFSPSYNRRKAMHAAAAAAAACGLRLERSDEVRSGGPLAGWIRFSAATGLPEPGDTLKLDFIEDRNDLCQVQEIEGYRVYTLPAVYYRKLRIACGDGALDAVGRMRGGRRQVARDLVDLYYLAVRFRSLADFALDLEKRGLFSTGDIERIHAWIRRFPREPFILECLDLDLVERVNPKQILRRMDWEADRLVTRRLEDGNE